MSYVLVNSSTAFPLLFLMVDSTDHITGKTGLSPTVTISKNGAAFASPAGAVTELANGFYKVAGNATDTNTNGPLLLHATGTGADPVDIMFMVVAYNPADSVRLGLTGIPNAAAGASGGLPLSADASGRVDVLKINGTNQTARDIGASVLLSSGTGTGQIVLSSGNVSASVISGGIVAASFATDSINSTALATNAAAEIATSVWANATRSLTTLTGLTLPTIPANWLTASGLAADAATEIATSVWATATRSLTTLAGLTLPTVTTLTNLPAITTNWLTANGLASDAVAEIQSGLATSSALTTAQADLDIITGTAGVLIDSGTGAGQINLSSGSVVNVTNVTNLTNAPTSGDLTATMKTSVETAAASAITTYDPPTNAELQARTLESSAYFDPATDTVATVTTLTNLPAATADWLTSSAIHSGALAAIANAIITAGDIDGYTLEEILKIISTSAAGTTSDTETGTILFRAVDDSKTRITAVTDSNNNRTAITYDVTG